MKSKVRLILAVIVLTVVALSVFIGSKCFKYSTKDHDKLSNEKSMKISYGLDQKISIVNQFLVVIDKEQQAAKLLYDYYETYGTAEQKKDFGEYFKTFAIEKERLEKDKKSCTKRESAQINYDIEYASVDLDLSILNLGKIVVELSVWNAIVSIKNSNDNSKDDYIVNSTLQMEKVKKVLDTVPSELQKLKKLIDNEKSIS